MIGENIFQKDITKKLFEYSNENDYLKEKISLLENKNNTYQNKILDLKCQIKELLEMQQNNRNLTEEKKNFQNRIKNLEKEIIDVTQNIKGENRQTENQLENELIFYKGLHETGIAKVDAADNIIKLNNAQNKYIIDLENELEQLRNNSDVTVCKLKIEHDLHYYNLKKKMMDYVKEIQHNMAQNNKDNMELNSKLNMLYKNQMLNELEHQALQIKALLQIKQKYEKLIFVLKQELDLHKKAEKSFISKNMKYLNIIKDIDKNYSNNSYSKILNNKNINGNKFSLSEKKTKKKYNKLKLQLENNKNENLYEAQLSITNNIINNNLYRESNLYKDYDKNNKKYYDEYIAIKKLYDELYKENQNLKEQLTTMKDKQKMFNYKYSGIIKLYKSGLDELLINEELKNKSIHINKELINSGNYDSFTKEQKHTILIALIKDLLPLIDKNFEDNDINILRNSFQQSHNFKTSSTHSSRKEDSTSRNINVSKLSKLNFRSVLDNRINICLNNNSNYFENSQKLNSIYRSNKGVNSLRTLTDEKSEIINKLNGKIKDKFTNRNQSLKLFKCMNIESKDKPLRFIYIKNTFDKDNDSRYKVDSCLTKNNFFS